MNIYVCMYVYAHCHFIVKVEIYHLMDEEVPHRNLSDDQAVSSSSVCMPRKAKS